MSHPNPLGLTVSALKTWASREGGGYQCWLLAGGKKALYVHNDGNGGPIDITPEGDFGKSIHAQLRAHCAALPKVPERGYDVDDEMFVASLVDGHENQKRFDAMLRRAQKGLKLCFRLEGEEPLSFRHVQMKRADQAEAARAFVTKKYGDKAVFL